MHSITFKTVDSELIRAVNEFVAEWNGPESVIRVKTSGSTGIPKEITLQKEYMRASADRTIAYLGLKENDKALLCLSPTTIAGKMMIVRSIIAGMSLTVAGVTRNPLNDIDEAFDFTAMVPMQVESSIRNSLNQFKKIRKVIIGGAPISAELYEMIWQNHSGCYHTFGMTETISHIAMRKISEEKLPYEALSGVKLETKDHRLVIHAPHLGIPTLETNDIVDLTDDHHFYWKGRSDFVINSGGIKIHPEEIEHILDGVIKEPFFVCGIDDETLGQKLILCIEGQKDIQKQELVDLLPAYQMPKEIYFFKKFHYTRSGKVNRLQTIEQLNDVEKQVL